MGKRQRTVKILCAKRQHSALESWDTENLPLQKESYETEQGSELPNLKEKITSPEVHNS